MCEVFKQRPSLAAAMIGQAVPVTVRNPRPDHQGSVGPVWGTVRPYVHWERPQSVKGSYDTVKSRCLCLLACRAAVLALPQPWAVVFLVLFRARCFRWCFCPPLSALSQRLSNANNGWHNKPLSRHAGAPQHPPPQTFIHLSYAPNQTPYPARRGVPPPPCFRDPATLTRTSASHPPIRQPCRWISPWT